MDAPFSEVVASKTTRGNWDSEGKLKQKRLYVGVRP